MKRVVMFSGQGSQYKGMGKDLFSKYRSETNRASDILGYDLEELCVNDPNRNLAKTQFTQPALYVVNAFSYYEHSKESPDYFIGHSLGEYNALHASGAFDFETGLCMVQKRGAVMGAASGGGMAAVLGLDQDSVKMRLEEGGYKEIDIANYNTPAQTVLSGPQVAIDKVVKDFDSRGIRIIPLFVTAPFHSRYMQSATEAFDAFLKNLEFSSLKIPVIANATARPYDQQHIRELLSQQITSPVHWTDTIRYLMGKEVTGYEEIGSAILGKMVDEIKNSCSPILDEVPRQALDNGIDNLNTRVTPIVPSQNPEKNIDVSTRLGSRFFREAYGVKYAYVTGGMYRGIASKELVVRMGKSKMLSFLGTGGMPLEEIEVGIRYIQEELTKGMPYGMNLLHNLIEPMIEMETVKLYLKYGVVNIEAAAYMQMSPSLVYYRLKGLHKGLDGTVVCGHRVLGKVSRPEVAKAFMSPAPEKIVSKLLDQGLITEEEAALSKGVPMSYDICVEADSGGHTDGGVALVLLPAIQALRDEISEKHRYKEPIRIGLAGGIGTPQAVACAFVMGADFVLTGSINQCTVEAGVSAIVKDLLQDINVQDTTYAPAGDMFEIGAKVQVMKKGILFAARANKLYALYQQYDALEAIPENTLAKIEKSYFKKSITEIWEETKVYLIGKGKENVIREAEQNPKKKMVLVFRWYFEYSSTLSFKGSISEKVNFQVHTGPALGAFNQWVKGTKLESWKNRHADQIGIKMMKETSVLLKNKLSEMSEK